MKKWPMIIAAIAAPLILTGCMSGDDGETDPSTSVKSIKEFSFVIDSSNISSPMATQVAARMVTEHLNKAFENNDDKLTLTYTPGSTPNKFLISAVIQDHDSVPYACKAEVLKKTINVVCKQKS